MRILEWGFRHNRSDPSLTVGKVCPLSVVSKSHVVFFLAPLLILASLFFWGGMPPQDCVQNDKKQNNPIILVILSIILHTILMIQNGSLVGAL